jgi:hypothetical protein
MPSAPHKGSTPNSDHYPNAKGTNSQVFSEGGFLCHAPRLTVRANAVSETIKDATPGNAGSDTLAVKSATCRIAIYLKCVYMP